MRIFLFMYCESNVTHGENPFLSASCDIRLNTSPVLASSTLWCTIHRVHRLSLPCLPILGVWGPTYSLCHEASNMVPYVCTKKIYRLVYNFPGKAPSQAYGLHFATSLFWYIPVAVPNWPWQICINCLRDISPEFYIGGARRGRGGWYNPAKKKNRRKLPCNSSQWCIPFSKGESSRDSVTAIYYKEETETEIGGCNIS